MRYGPTGGSIWEVELATDTVGKHDPSFERRGMAKLIQVSPDRVVVSVLFRVWELAACNLSSE